MSLEILQIAFKQAEKEIGSNRKTHLARHLSDVLQEDYNYTISERTLRDYFNKIEKGDTGPQDDLKPKLIEPLCQYLGYANYAEFIKSHGSSNRRIPEQEVINPTKKSSKKIWVAVLLICLSIGVAISFLISQRSINESNAAIYKECMTWADSTYLKIACDVGPYSKYGTKVIPYEENRFKNLKRVKVHLAYNFFNEKGQPLVWYFRNDEKQYEFFTAPGLHPISEKTLKAITPYIIQKHVPLHNDDEDSFIE
ncbi:hypothetical protein [Zobellia russellii]|uniref:hypothetical protein n=1 Tax=Zobellia russellii TaxID=248907 RepID=UPI001BFFA2F6|nr:hypothetical protein [Zobellia russellii]MBT9190402.1 hypothetical protein [Zobellia russellii]